MRCAEHRSQRHNDFSADHRRFSINDVTMPSLRVSNCDYLLLIIILWLLLLLCRCKGMSSGTGNCSKFCLNCNVYVDNVYVENYKTIRAEILFLMLVFKEFTIFSKLLLN